MDLISGSSSGFHLSVVPVLINLTNTPTISKTVSGRTQGLKYSFTVAGVDAGGRIGEKSVPSYIVLDSKYLKRGFHDFYQIFYLVLNTTLEGVDFIPSNEKILKIS